MQLSLVLQILLVAAIVAGVAGVYACRDRRSSKDRRRASRGGRRAGDGAVAEVTETTDRAC
jgi:hypothetical protein